MERYNKVYNENIKKFRAYIKKYSNINKKSPEDNMSILSDMYIHLTDKLYKFEDEDKLTSYLYQYIYNQLRFSNSKLNRIPSREKRTTSYDGIELEENNNYDNILSSEPDFEIERLDDYELRQFDIFQKFREFNIINDRLFEIVYEKDINNYSKVTRHLHIASKYNNMYIIDKMKFVIQNMSIDNSLDVKLYDSLYDVYHSNKNKLKL